MTLLHHLSTQHFSSPKALVTEVTDGDCVCARVCCVVLCVCLCAYLCVGPCVQAGSVAQVVFELMANRCEFARPYV